MRSGNVSPPPYLVWYFSYFFRGFSILLSIPCSSLCSSWSALKIAYFVFAFEHVFYPTRTHGRRHCQSTLCYSSCAVRNISAVHFPPFGIPTLIHTSSLIHKLKVRIFTYLTIAGNFHCKTFSPTVYWHIQWHILLITKKKDHLADSLSLFKFSLTLSYKLTKQYVFLSLNFIVGRWKLIRDRSSLDTRSWGAKGEGRKRA